MERLFRPDKLSTLHSDVNAEKKYKYWKRCFDNFLASIPAPQQPATINKLGLLINYIEPDVFDCISEETDYDAAITALETLYIKPVNVIYARHMLVTRKQDSSESLDFFLQALKGLAKPCQFELPTTAKLYEEEYIRDAFISGLVSPAIRQRLLEEESMTLAQAFDKARAIEVARAVQSNECHCCCQVQGV